MGRPTTRSTCARRSSTASTRRAYGYWGFSPSDNPSGGYSAYGVDAIGMQADGYPSNNDNTFVDHGFGDCRPAKPDPPPSAYTNGVVTPHASFLALRFAPRAALANLARLRSHFAVYGKGGFYDAVNVDSGQVARSYLALDQGMVMAARGQRAERRPPAELLRPGRDRAAHPPAAGDGAVHRRPRLSATRSAERRSSPLHRG